MIVLAILRPHCSSTRGRLAASCRAPPLCRAPAHVRIAHLVAVPTRVLVDEADEPRVADAPSDTVTPTHREDSGGRRDPGIPRGHRYATHRHAVADPRGRRRAGEPPC